MKQAVAATSSILRTGRALILLCVVSACVSGQCEPPAAAIRAFNLYAGKVESRLRDQHRRADGFVVSVGTNIQKDDRLRQGQFIVEQLSPGAEAQPPEALLHHWRGTAFLRGATAAGFEQLMKNFSRYPQTFAPQVLRASILGQEKNPDHFTLKMRVRQRHVITVVMDSTCDIQFARLDAQHGYSISRSKNITEIEAPDTSREHALNENEEHGFLWRMNTYWSYEERDGGLYMQVESLSLTRAIPVGLGWAVRPFLESVPRESLEFTLRATCNALKK